MFTSDQSIPNTDFPFFKFAYRYQDGIFRVYEIINTNKKSSIQITELDEKYVPTRRDTISDYFQGGSEIDDVLPLKNYDVLVGYKKISIYNRISRTQVDTKYVLGIKKIFDEVSKINDTLLLLAGVDDLHPLDGPCGLNLLIFNIKSNEIEKERLVKVPGVAMADMSVKLISSNNNEIYYFSPLSTNLYTFDININLKSINHIDFEMDYNNNNQFEKNTDSLMYGEWMRLYKIYAGIPIVTDSLIDNLQSVFFTKDYLVKMISTINNEFDHIDKIIPLADNLICIGVARKGVKIYRDVYFVNLKSGFVIKKYRNWLNSPAQSYNRIEDCLPLSFATPKYQRMCFNKDEVFESNLFNPIEFNGDNKDSVDLAFQNRVLKNGYKWNIIKYQLK
ncbi:MAG: hypothetical protein JST06_04295 [Bacteroidetes bacterium]|nr:hypothetical protein [Bacteroidota bacterium]